MVLTRRYAAPGLTMLGASLALLLAVPAGAQVTQEFHRTVPLSANGTVSLDNVNGNVEITGWDRDQVQIDAVKSASDQQKADEARIDVEGSGDSVHIATRYPQLHSNNNPASVFYKLQVPRDARLDRINLVNGSLSVQNIHGEVVAALINGKLQAHDLQGRAELSTVNGSLEAAYASLKNVQKIKLSSVSGSIDLLLPQSPNANLSASSVSGGIRMDFPLEVRGQYVGKSVSGTLGSGGTEIKLSNVSGGIHVGPGRGSL